MVKTNIVDVKKNKRPVALLILDGWGLSPAWGGNALAVSQTRNMDYLWRNYPHAILQAFRRVAGPEGQVSSSEIGHASIGSGRVVDQDLTEINTTIDNGLFFQNQKLKNAFREAAAKNQAIHLMGLLSDGGIHSYDKHAFALAEFAKREGVRKLWIHIFTDGRDVETFSAQKYIHKLEKHLERLQLGQIATVVGRFYAMDRDNNWNRIAACFEALVYGKGNIAQTAEQAVAQGYRNGFDDEHLPPTIILNNSDPTAKPALPAGRILANDTVIFWNFRADRARQLTRAFLDPSVFKKFIFWRRYPIFPINFLTLTDYHLRLANLDVIFPRAVLEATLGELLATHGLTQLHIAESEKYAHVTYFFNGGREEEFIGEDRIIVPSIKTDSYESVPQMRASTIAKLVNRAIKTKSHDFIVANFSNVDMLAHTGNLIAIKKAVEVVDESVRTIANTVLANNAALFITADHGNAESAVSIKPGNKETLHSLNPVPFIYVARDAKKPVQSPQVTLNEILPGIMRSPHSLADVAPTILELFGIAKPSIMTGESLFDKMD